MCFLPFISAKITFFPLPAPSCLFLTCSFKVKIKIYYWAYQTLLLPSKMEYTLIFLRRHFHNGIKASTLNKVCDLHVNPV